jgi:hypothetical protein
LEVNIIIYLLVVVSTVKLCVDVELGLSHYEEHRLRVFGNRVLRRICGPKREEVVRGWRVLHNEELHDLCTSPSI